MPPSCIHIENFRTMIAKVGFTIVVTEEISGTGSIEGVYDRATLNRGLKSVYYSDQTVRRCLNE